MRDTVGADQVLKLGNGAGDYVFSSGSGDNVTTGTGLGDQVVAAGRSRHIAMLGAQALLHDAIGDTNETFVAKAGHGTFDIGLAISETLALGGSAHNVINVAASADNNATINGVTKTDVFHFADTFADAKITTAGGYTTVDFASGQHVTLAGTHDAATFAGNPAFHYI